MTLYCYKCDRCEVERDVVHAITESPIIRCLACGGDMFRKIGCVIVNVACGGFVGHLGGRG